MDSSGRTSDLCIISKYFKWNCFISFPYLYLIDIKQIIHSACVINNLIVSCIVVVSTYHLLQYAIIIINVKQQNYRECFLSV